MSPVLIIPVLVGVALLAALLWFALRRALSALPENKMPTGRAEIVASTATAVVTAALLGGAWWQFSGRDKFAPPTVASAAVAGPSSPSHAGDISVLLKRLEERLSREPDNAEAWALFARTHMELQHYPDAARAYAKATQMLPKDAALHVEFVDAEVMANNKTWTKPALDSLKAALKLEPTNAKALWLAGTERFERKDYAAAVKHWELLAKNSPPESEYAREIAPALIEARALRDGRDVAAALASANVAVPPIGTPRGANAQSLAADARAAMVGELRTALGVAAPVAVAATAGGQKRVRGEVRLDAALANMIGPDDTVFVFARNDSPSANPAQARTPLAVTRFRASELPAKFDLSDSDAMSPDLTLSQARRVVIAARISKTGDAAATKGDLEGISAAVDVGASGVDVLIKSRLP